MMTQLKYLAYFILVLLLIAACSQKPQSDVDTPEYHYRAGMRSIDKGDYEAALNSFERSIDLNRKFALGKAGKALAIAYLGESSKAKTTVENTFDIAKKEKEVMVVLGRTWIILRSTEKRWFKRASKYLDLALKKDKNYEPALYYYGEAYLYNYEFGEAEDYFKKVIELKGNYTGKADEKWQLSQQVVRAAPGSIAGKKVALQPTITRADLSVLFVEEMQIDKLFDKMPDTPVGFQTPSQMASSQQTPTATDIGGHWANVWITDAIKYGVLDVFPDGKFYPDETVSRAVYAMASQRLIVAATRDTDLEIRYFGESPSRFSDVPSSHPAYNAMALCAERGIMKADVITGRFDPNGTVGGAEALLIIRTLQSSLRMTF